METIIDLTDGEGGHEALTSTEVSGRLRTERLLSGDPLESYLEGEEEPKYVMRNKKSGVTVKENGDTREMTPTDDLQTLVLVTDVRVRFVVGTAGGDQTAAVPYPEMVQAKSTDDGFRTTALVIETIEGRRWSFPCRGDTAEVASFVDGLAQVWANAERLADEAEQSIQEAREHCEDGDHEAAAESLVDVESKLKTAVERLSEVGAGAGAHIRERAESLARQLLAVQGPIRAQLAASAHADAMAAWREGEYERAAAAYERAIGGYQVALERDSGPDNERLRRRLQGAISERELLCVSPLVEADTSRRRAREIDEPEAAAANWEDVLERYRALLTLEWPGDVDFVADTGLVRKQAIAAAEDAVGDYFEAGKRRLGSADRFAVDNHEDRAMVLYERAHEQFEQAHRLAVEAESDRVDETEAALKTVEERLAGDVPTETVPPDAVSVAAADADADATTPDGDGAAEEDAPGPSDRSETGSSVIGRIQSQKQQEAEDGQTSVGATAEGTAGRTITNTELRAKLRELDDGEFTQLVADLWEAQGWSTTVFSATKQVVYDIVAMREEPEQQRLLLWTEHRPGDEQLGPRAVERCATARDSSQGAETATLVTNALPRTAAEQRAEGLEVTVIDGQDLVELLRFEGFLDRLDHDAPSA